MSIDRLWNLEGRVERLSDALARLKRQLDALQQQMYQMSSRTGMPGGGGGGLVPFSLPTGIVAGTPASPSSATNAVMMLPNPTPPGFTTTGGRTMTVYNPFATAISGTNKFAWFILKDDGFYYLSTGDC